ncbi:MAG TPA: hypothetical protein VFA54_07065 [Bryobacterales bacterium]|nr:hypothetical protein [Bryobacterales bacterium]
MRKAAGCFLILLAWAAGAQGSPKAGRIFFSKSFPGSIPEYFAIEVEASGSATYRESPAEEDPLRFTLSASDTKEIFALAEKLQFFRKPLESKLKLANMGMKLFRYEDGPVRNEVKFNFSEDPNARALADWFEKIGETERHRIALERAARFDRLGVNKALLALEISWDNHRIVAPEQLLPVLDKIATQPNFVHIAQARAASLAERIRTGKTAN